MTTLWKPNGEWAGQTVAVLASGPSMSSEVAESLREHRSIAVNFAIKAAPWADMMVALDGNWPQDFREFAGMRVTGVADDDLDALYCGPMHERITLGPSHQVEIHNSGLGAVRIAAGMGATRIILAGFEPETPRHFYDDEVDTGEYVGVAIGLKAITAELAERGIAVERYTPQSSDVTIHIINEEKPRTIRGGASDVRGR